jgi:phage terminase large subunit
MTHLTAPIARPFIPLLTLGRWRYKIFYGGRGGGKSHAFAEALIALAAMYKLRILCCREIQNSIGASVKQLLDDKIIKLGLSHVYYSTQFGITCTKTGSEFMFAGLRSNPDKVKSMEGLDIVWIEEANRTSMSSWNLLTPTVRKTASEIWCSFNRHSLTDPIDVTFLGGEPPPKSLIRAVSHDDNPWFPQVLRDEMEWDKGRDPDKWRHVWEGEPLTRSSARVFHNWEVDDLDHAIPDGCVPRYGADWGFSRDPTVLIKSYVWDDVLYLQAETWKVKCEIDDTPGLWFGNAPDGERWNNLLEHRGIPEAYQARIVADNARPETISHLNRKYGTRIVPSRKGAGSIVEGVEFIKSKRVVIHPDCKHIIDEFTHYSYKIDKLTDEPLAELADKKNHTIDSIRYALEDVRKSERRGPAGTTPGMIITG